jgi:hypothetical protein
MPLRITLLALAAGLFALIWTHDRPAPRTGINPPAELAQAAKPSQSVIVSRPVSQVQTVIPMPEVAMDEAWMFNDCGMPLPPGIVPGEYRGVSNTGLVREFTLTLDDLQTYRGRETHFVTRDIYQSETESLRWYFIRVQSESAETMPVIPERGGHIIIPAVAERSEAKQLQRQASRIIVNAGQKMASRIFRSIAIEGPARISAEIKDRIRL